MATLLNSMARRCVEQYDLHLRDFRRSDDFELLGYCSERIEGVLLEEALDRKPATMGVCISQAVQNKDLEAAFRHLAHMDRHRSGEAMRELQHIYMVVLAHEIKAVLIEIMDTVNARI